MRRCKAPFLTVCKHGWLRHERSCPVPNVACIAFVCSTFIFSFESVRSVKWRSIYLMQFMQVYVIKKGALRSHYEKIGNQKLLLCRHFYRFFFWLTQIESNLRLRDQITLQNGQDEIEKKILLFCQTPIIIVFKFILNKQWNHKQTCAWN